MGSETPLQRGSLTGGVLILPITEHPSQIDGVSADIETAKGLRLHTVQVIMLATFTGWRELPGLFDRILELPVTAAHVILGAEPGETSAAGDHLARALGRRPRPPHLEELWVTAAGLSAAGLERMTTLMAGLKRLSLRDNALPDGALQLLSAGEQFASLEELSFGGNRPTARGIRALANARLPLLSRLGLSSCELGLASVSRLAEGSLAALTRISLSLNPIGDDGAQTLAESPFAEQLEHVELRRCGIGDVGAAHLANSPSLRDVGVLDLRGNEFGDRGRKLLQDRFGERSVVT